MASTGSSTARAITTHRPGALSRRFANTCIELIDRIADSQAPRITPARGPPLWEDCGAPVGEGVEVEPDWDISAQIAPDYQADQRISARAAHVVSGLAKLGITVRETVFL